MLMLTLPPPLPVAVTVIAGLSLCLLRLRLMLVLTVAAVVWLLHLHPISHPLSCLTGWSSVLISLPPPDVRLERPCVALI